MRNRLPDFRRRPLWRRCAAFFVVAVRGRFWGVADLSPANLVLVAFRSARGRRAPGARRDPWTGYGRLRVARGGTDHHASVQQCRDGAGGSVCNHIEPDHDARRLGGIIRFLGTAEAEPVPVPDGGRKGLCQADSASARQRSVWSGGDQLGSGLADCRMGARRALLGRRRVARASRPDRRHNLAADRLFPSPSCFRSKMARGYRQSRCRIVSGGRALARRCHMGH